MADTKTLPLVEEEAQDTCCDPVCGPDTCGPSADVQYVPIEKARAEAAQCCEPECGPDTCTC